jgi:hypothetical protein
MAGFIRALTEAQHEGFPLEPFTNKIEEGVAKRVPSPLIQTVLAKKLEDYRFTKSTIQETFEKHGEKNPVIPHGYLLRLSESLSCGLSREELRTLLEHASSPPILPPLAMAAETMASLKQNQFDPAMAQQIAIALSTLFHSGTERHCSYHHRCQEKGNLRSDSEHCGI